MLTVEEIRRFIQEDRASAKKKFAITGQRYYDGDHDIKNYKLYYFNDAGEVVEDKNRSNIKISHPFFMELVDQATQYILSGEDGIFRSDIPELQSYLDDYFNQNEDFIAETSEVITGTQVKGFDYLYAYKKEDGTTAFQCADSIGVTEVRAKDTKAKDTDYVIYSYVDRIEEGQKKIKRIQVWDDTQTYFYVQVDDGEIVPDESEPINPRPHIIKVDEKGEKYDGGGYGMIPFFRLDNCKKQFSDLKPIKALIDDYDLHACGLSNNLQDASEYLIVVKGFEGDSMDKLQKNLKTKKIIGLPAEGNEGIDYKVVDIPYEARKIKLELDEKNIYRFGFGLNTAGLKDTAATTNIAIRAAYALLDLKAKKLEIRIRQMFRKILKLVLKEINDMNGTDYQQKDVYFVFDHEIISNEQENAQIELVEAQKQQVLINMLLSVAVQLGDDLLIEQICDVLDLDYEQIKDKLPKDEDPYASTSSALDTLQNAPAEKPVEQPVEQPVIQPVAGTE